RPCRPRQGFIFVYGSQASPTWRRSKPPPPLPRRYPQSSKARRVVAWTVPQRLTALIDRLAQQDQCGDAPTELDLGDEVRNFFAQLSSVGGVSEGLVPFVCRRYWAARP